jgi:hypothetical protein
LSNLTVAGARLGSIPVCGWRVTAGLSASTRKRPGWPSRSATVMNRLAMAPSVTPILVPASVPSVYAAAMAPERSGPACSAIANAPITCADPSAGSHRALTPSSPNSSTASAAR